MASVHCVRGVGSLCSRVFVHFVSGFVIAVLGDVVHCARWGWFAALAELNMFFVIQGVGDSLDVRNSFRQLKTYK